jgi:hypothetical protein
MYIALGVVAGILLLGWLGFQVQPKPFADYPEASQTPPTVPLPAGLPAPVERYYRLAYGDEIPVVDSVIVTGRGKMRPVGFWMPMRFRFTHDAGKGYRHYIETCWFGLPIMKVNERYVDGKSLMELPWATDEGPKVEQAANLGMWAELSAAAPAVLLTDPRVQWKPVDENTAVLVVPLGDEATDTFVVRFDPGSGDIVHLEAMRYQASSSERKVLWIAAGSGEKRIGPAKSLAVGSATWLSTGKPWAFFETEELRFNVDVTEYLRSRGL